MAELTPSKSSSSTFTSKKLNFEDEISKIDKKLFDLLEASKFTATNANDLANTVSSNQKEIDNLLAKISDLEKQVEEYKRLDVKSSIDAASYQKSQLENQALKTQNEILQEKQKSDQIDRNNLISTFNLEQEKLKEEITNLKTQIAEIQNKNEKLILQFDNEKQEFMLQKQNLETEKSNLLKNLEIEQQNVINQRNEINSFQNEMNRFQTENQLIQSKLNDQNTKISLLENELQLMKSENKKIDNEKQNLIQEHQKANEYLVTALQRLSQIRNNLDSLIQNNVGGIQNIFAEMKKNLEISNSSVVSGQKKISDVLIDLQGQIPIALKLQMKKQ